MIGSVPFQSITKKVLRTPKVKTLHSNQRSAKGLIGKTDLYKAAGTAGLVNAVYMTNSDTIKTDNMGENQKDPSFYESAR